MKIKRFLRILFLLLICIVIVEFIAGPHIYNTVNEAMITKQGYSAKIRALMSKEEFDSINVYNSYQISKEDNSNVELKLYPIAMIHNFKDGYVWMNYSITITDKSGEIIAGSWDIPIKITLKKVDGIWYLTNIYEPA